MTETQRRNPIKPSDYEAVKQTSCSSLSTEGSSSPRYHQAKCHKSSKDKLQLCKKYTEYGYCPYQKKCKFAHGYHELRKNNSTNSKYKTKECVTYVKNCYCHYGSRCNFIHSALQEQDLMPTRQEMRGYLQIFQYAKTQSRVLAMLRN